MRALQPSIAPAGPSLRVRHAVLPHRHLHLVVAIPPASVMVAMVVVVVAVVVVVVVAVLRGVVLGESG